MPGEALSFELNIYNATFLTRDLKTQLSRYRLVVVVVAVVIVVVVKQ